MEGKLRLEIINPCQADWSKMTAAEAGRYCSNCEKTVLDFSALSKEEIIEKVKNRKTPLCIRALKTEIDPPIKTSHDVGAYKGFGLAASLLLFGAVTTGFSSAFHNPSFNASPLPEIEQGISNHSIPKNKIITDSNRMMISGVVKDSITQEPLAYAIVSIKGTSIGTNTDIFGNFNIEIPKEYQEKPIVLICSYIAYESKEIVVAAEDVSNLQVVQMQESQIYIVGELIIHEKPRKKFWQFWR